MVRLLSPGCVPPFSELQQGLQFMCQADCSFPCPVQGAPEGPPISHGCAALSLTWRIVPSKPGTWVTIRHIFAGNHIGPTKTPSREDDPRAMPPNFYYNVRTFTETATCPCSISHTANSS